MGKRICLILLVFCHLRIGFSAKIRVLKFDPINGGNNTDKLQVNIDIDPRKNYSKGFSVCLRANFNLWDSKCLFKIEENLILQFFNHHSDNDDFNWLSSWQSYCISYDVKTTHVKLYVNGKERVSLADPLNPIVNLGSIIKIGRCGGKSYQGLLTDLNAWTRPLAEDEIKIYSSGCQEEFVKQTFPDLLSWSDNNFTINREYVKEMFIERNKLCQQTSPLSMATHVLQVLDWELPYKKAVAMCDSLGGQLPQPKDAVDFTNTFPDNELLPLVPKACKHNFWIPIEKRGHWIFEDNSGNETVLEFLPWESGYPRGKFQTYVNKSTFLTL